MELLRSKLLDGRSLIIRKAVPGDDEETIAHLREVIGASDYLF